MSPLVEHTQHLDWLHDVLPALPFVIILGTEGRRVFMGKASFEKAVASVLERSFISGAAMGVGALIHFLYGGIISLPATVSTRLVLSRFFNFRRLEATLVRKVEIVRVIAAARSPGPRYLSSGIPSGLAGFLPAPICPTL